MVSAIIVAAGKGIRMNDTVRKQYLSLSGRPILAHTLLAFDGCNEIESVFLVVSEEDIDFCQKTILFPLQLEKKIELVPGGAERQDSVYNGLMAMDRSIFDTVVIHDGVRPFIRPEHLTTCIKCTEKSDACIFGIPVSDTLKHVNGSGYIDKTLDRDSVWQAQTPQAFRLELIIKAHEYARRDGFRGTDDALLVERMGKRIKMIKGSRRNIKITTREDLMFARAMFQSENI